MTQEEYDKIQSELSNLLKNDEYKFDTTSYAKGFRKGYKEAVLACKSTLHRYNPKQKENWYEFI